MKRILQENWRWLLVLSCVPLFATKTLFNLPFAIMMLLGLYRLLREPGLMMRDRGVALLGIVFLCFELPILLSLPDAVEPRRALSTAAVDLRFYLAGVFVVETLRDPRARLRLFQGTALLVLIWSLDALLQMLAGRDLLGYPYNGSRPTGIFHPKLRLGTVTATLFPVVLEWLRQRAAGRPWLWLLLPPLIAIIFLSGNRNAWMMLAVGLALYAVYLVRVLERRQWLRLMGVTATAGVLMLAAALQYAPFEQRMQQTLGLFSDSERSQDAATGNRLSLWKTAWNMYRAHWFNGVGPRGYRYAYLQHADADDFWVRSYKPGEQGYPQMHPHQMLLEVMAETGTLGLIGYLLLLYLLIRMVWQVPPRRRPDVWPWGVATLVAWFPGNAHMALYASYWGSIAWWLLLVTLALARAETSEG